MSGFKVGDRVYVDAVADGDYFGPGTVTRVKDYWVEVQSDTAWDEHTPASLFQPERLCLLDNTPAPHRDEDEWQLTRTAHETALRAVRGFLSKSSGSRAGRLESVTTAASDVTGSTSGTGSTKTARSDEEQSSGTTSAQRHASRGMGSVAPTTTSSSKPSTANAPSASSPTRDEPYTSITTTATGVYAGFSVLPATQESGSSDTLQFTVSAPPGTFAHPAARSLYERLFDLVLLSAAKQADYGRDEDPFANVRASSDWAIPAWIGSMVRLNDKVKRLQALAQKGGLQNESALDSFDDIAVYALISRILYEQESA